ncbi:MULTISPECIES: SDR family oxidoreductase [Idiomarina]|jgi:3-oxoacyl-[acyl-carrier protein] reductase|uniref:SDR family oxidoreductase n=1 Tax=Idiomarina TaxID=135575 RepID=UPI000C0AF4D1|nr:MULTISPECIES: SDR family oxidoreductase [Idiomarina]MAC34679.1 beta-ketoacyl-ACP reductase [Haliea sp.]MAO68558.1 beta-ketoacyl-ACP reductase [Idiomarina sp.]MBF39150.1 beta-ketoacyl-ACP reductase [Idiomarinaceae bacterium]MBF81293.1 beta-ketoacyl-ACP reductase [Idiomarina sp.]|tara:strand:+ start:7164 stop:7889 length:726 start_codon:yes stop_codon:yes gene_type:complete
MNIKAKIALVTGGSKGIGLEISKRLVEKGVKVISLTRTTYKPIQSNFFEEFNVDLSHDDSGERVLDYLRLNEISEVSYLVNNAGVTKDSLIEKMNVGDWNTVLDSNLKSAFLITKSLLPLLRESDTPSIVNVSSIIGNVGNIGQSNYSASKGALVSLTKTWAKEFNRKEQKIRVNSVSPGFIATEMLKSVPEKFLNKVTEQTPLGRLGTARDVADVVAFLLSDEAKFINGADVPVDGGLVW